MDNSERSAQEGSIVIGCGLVSVSRELAEKNNLVPTPDRIELAKAAFNAVGIKGADSLIDVLRSLETSEAVIGYFGFTIDKDGLTKKPLGEGETEGERMMKVMSLPHPQWGHRTGSATALADLVTLAVDLKPGILSTEQQLIFSRAFSDAAVLLSRNSCNGEA